MTLLRFVRRAALQQRFVQPQRFALLPCFVLLAGLLLFALPREGRAAEGEAASGAATSAASQAAASAAHSAAHSATEAFHQPLQPPTTGGLARVDRALAKLTHHRRLLVVGAHPDDEDTSLLSLVSRGMGGEAAYLSLTRGEGGQNLIGPELGPALGLIRSGELVAARNVDGARQFFSRAYDFGYTRSLEETLGFWPREVLVEDAVRVIRRFRPQVVVSIFPPDARAGHGQHQAAGVVAGEAFAVAGEAGAFPELAAQGLPPWSPVAFYRNTWFDRDAATVVEPAARLDPVSGRSVFQIAMESRSSHRSQDMGMLQPLGPRAVHVAWEAGAGQGGDHLFAGVDTRLPALAATLPVGDARTAVTARLERVQELAAEARAELAPERLAGAARALASIVDELRAARAVLETGSGVETGRGVETGSGAPAGPEAAARLHVTALLAEKQAIAEAGLLAAAGVAADATTDAVALAQGDAWTVAAALWAAEAGAGAGARVSAGGSEVPVELLGVEIVSPAGLPITVDPLPTAEPEGWEAFFVPAADPEAGYHVRTFRARLGECVPATVPYFLRRPLDGALYNWSAAPPGVRGEPLSPPPLAARFRLRVAGVELVTEREVVQRYRDQATGEIRRPLRVVPGLEVAVSPDLLVQPVAAAGGGGAGSSRQLRVVLTSWLPRPVSGRLALDLPPGWAIDPAEPEATRFSLRPAGEPGDGSELTVTLIPGPDLQAGRQSIAVRAVVEGAPAAAAGDPPPAPSQAVPLVDYPHIRPVPYPEPAVVAVTATDLALPDLGRVAYVRGASDRVPEMLAEVGVPLEVLRPDALGGADLDAYDAVVIGPRAYEVEPALARANARLLDYARRGGLLLVQYQQYQFVSGGFAALPLDIARPHGRVTDETAPVRVLDPDHPVFHVPNEIGAADWQGWVQERGLYMPSQWDEAYAPLLEMRDPDQEEAQRGALLVATVGDGTYVYTGLAFFRQLPAGVPGAYRLFANLLALGGRATNAE